MQCKPGASSGHLGYLVERIENETKIVGIRAQREREKNNLLMPQNAESDIF